MNKRFLQTFNPSSGGTFMLAFCWALLGGLLLQLVVLPALPSLHAGHGLLKGGDWVAFHAEALELALQMAHNGWGVWELRPRGNAPIGLLSALYFVVGIYEPWLFLPINALLFGAAAFILHKLFKLIATTRHSFFAVLPFVMFPSALMIYGQVHKDIFSVTGTLIIIFVWADLAGRSMFKWHKILLPIVTMVTGLALVWLVRPYLLQPLLVAGLFVALILSVWVGRRRHGSWWCVLAICLSIQLSGVAVGMYSQSSRLTVIPIPSKQLVASNLSSIEKILSIENALAALDSSNPSSIENILSIENVLDASNPSNPSNPSASILETMVSKMNRMRAGFLISRPNAGSNIDIEVRFTSIEDILLYIPRALQISLLAPFPSMWLGDARTTGGGAMRVVAAMEMTVTYVLLMGFLGLWRCEKERWTALMVAVAMSLVLTLILTLVVANVGTVYRMRYASWQLLNGLGILGWGLWLQARRKRQNK